MKQPTHSCFFFFLSSRAGRGNTCSVAAGFKKGEHNNGSLTVCLQNMGKESKVRIFNNNTEGFLFWFFLTIRVYCTGLNKVSICYFILIVLFFYETGLKLNSKQE